MIASLGLSFFLINNSDKDLSKTPKKNTEYTFSTYYIQSQEVSDFLGNSKIETYETNLLAKWSDKLDKITEVDGWTIFYFKRELLFIKDYHKNSDAEFELKHLKERIGEMKSKKWYYIFATKNNQILLLEPSNILYNSADEINKNKLSDIIDFDHVDTSTQIDEMQGGKLPNSKIDINLKGVDFRDCIKTSHLGYKGHYQYSNIYQKNIGIIAEMSGHWVSGGIITLLSKN